MKLCSIYVGVLFSVWAVATSFPSAMLQDDEWLETEEPIYSKPASLIPPDVNAAEMKQDDAVVDAVENPQDKKAAEKSKKANNKSLDKEKLSKKTELAKTDPFAVRWSGGRGEEKFEKFAFKIKNVLKKPHKGKGKKGAGGGSAKVEHKSGGAAGSGNGKEGAAGGSGKEKETGGSAKVEHKSGGAAGSGKVKEGAAGGSGKEKETGKGSGDSANGKGKGSEDDSTKKKEDEDEDEDEDLVATYQNYCKRISANCATKLQADRRTVNSEVREQQSNNHHVCTAPVSSSENSWHGFWKCLILCVAGVGRAIARK